MKDILQLESEFRNYLDKDEKIIRVGQPRQGFFLKSTDYFIMIGFVFYLLFGRYALDIQKRKGTTYALTNKRAIVKSGIISQEIISYDLTL